jgi:2-polyprenyl-6-methoxyphenol hydroxylase-like FAD-dependent oxidoreductase
VQRDLLIVGGGFTGATLACALADGQRRIRVLEGRSAAPPARFAGELLHPTAVGELAKLSLLDPLLAAGAVTVEGFAVFPKPGLRPRLLPYSSVENARPHGLAMEHHQMVAVLRKQAAARPGVTLEYGARVVELLRDGERVVGVRLLGGRELRADLVLCADGRHSRLRPAPVDAQLLSFTAALRVPDAPLPQPGWGHIFLGAWGPILAYPVGGGAARLCFDLPLSISKERAADRLRAAYTHLLPSPLRAAVEVALDEGPLDLVANHAMRARQLTAPGLALVGDAGGCAHPLTAAGMTVCANDVRLIAETLAHDAPLDDYAGERRGFARSRAILTRSLLRVFRGSDPLARRLRDGVFRYWESPRARVASTALLTGADPTLRGFARELAKVAVSAIRA